MAIAGFNLVPLREGRDFFKQQTVLTRSDLAAIEIARRTVDPAFTLPPEIAVLDTLGLDNGVQRNRVLGSLVMVAAKLLEVGELQERLDRVEAALEARAKPLKAVSA